MKKVAPYMRLVGALSSYLEHHVTESIYSTEAVSSVKAIQLAHDMGVPVYTVTGENIDTVLPGLAVSDQVREDIQNAVNAGREVVVPGADLTVQDWTGVGYIILDPETGAGAYMISGGLGGSAEIIAMTLEDIAEMPVEGLSSNADASAKRMLLRLPGEDNQRYVDPDVFYTIYEFGELPTGECDEEDSECRIKYAYSHAFYKPLIDTEEHGLDQQLTKYIKASDWRSQDNAGFMRVGPEILGSIEYLMQIFGSTDHQLKAGSGYRTPYQNKKAGGSETSHHKDGTAADITLIDATPRKCEVLSASSILVGSSGEILHEGKKSTVHLAVPGKVHNDRNKHSWECQ